MRKEDVRKMTEKEMRDSHISKKIETWKKVLSNEKLMERALLEIAKWDDLPETGEYWDDDKTRPMSYCSWYGTNGERDYHRKLARQVLKEIGGYKD